MKVHHNQVAVNRRDELTLRREEEGVLRTSIHTKNVGDDRWEPPLVDEE